MPKRKKAHLLVLMLESKSAYMSIFMCKYVSSSEKSTFDFLEENYFIS